MNLIEQLLNKKTTLSQLAQLCRPAPAKVSGWREFCRLHKNLDPKSYANGRVNHQWIQKMIADISGDLIVRGGQGTKKSDCYINGFKVETKAYRPGNKSFHVAASGFFANNCKVPTWKALGKTTPEAEEYLFENSYSKNDYYLLTSTAQLNLDFDEIEFVLLKTDDLVDCLDSEDKRHCIMEKLNAKLEEPDV